MAELQARLSVEEQREEERGKEGLTLRQKLNDAEAVRDSLKKEVRIGCMWRGVAAHHDPHTVYFCHSFP